MKRAIRIGLVICACLALLAGAGLMVLARMLPVDIPPFDDSDLRRTPIEIEAEENAFTHFMKATASLQYPDESKQLLSVSLQWLHAVSGQGLPRESQLPLPSHSSAPVQYCPSSVQAVPKGSKQLSVGS